MFSVSVLKDCFATRVRVACKTLSTSALATRAAVTQTCPRTEHAGRRAVADALPPDQTECAALLRLRPRARRRRRLQTADSCPSHRARGRRRRRAAHSVWSGGSASATARRPACSVRGQVWVTAALVASIEVDTVLQATLTLVAKQSFSTLTENMRALLSRDQRACLVCDRRPEDPWV